MSRALIASSVAALLSLSAGAQEKKKIVIQEDRNAVFVGSAAVHAGSAGTGVQFFHMQSDVVKGAPYSAESSTESVQLLADGNRIVNKSGGKQYRDSEGRTRFDGVVAPMGIWVSEATPAISNIHDPVSGEDYMLDHNRKVAVKTGLRRMVHARAAGAPEAVDPKIEHKEVHIEVRRSVKPGEGEPKADVLAYSPAVAAPAPGAMMMRHRTVPDGASSKTESLGKQVVEGVECEGTRESFTIEAGKMGNERAITTVTERWYSPKLQQDVLRVTKDPRFGEITYKLTNISQGDQPRSLFEVPSEYKTEEPAIERIVGVEKRKP